mmetsp:Transcript_52083/g.110776  ORF Transcript_52083/g.110776 Transcript_52083/m.110776 type:complete len:228 (+) Transcript_52083:733-1416(+)
MACRSPPGCGSATAAALKVAVAEAPASSRPRLLPEVPRLVASSTSTSLSSPLLGPVVGASAFASARLDPAAFAISPVVAPGRLAFPLSLSLFPSASSAPAGGSAPFFPRLGFLAGGPGWALALLPLAFGAPADFAGSVGELPGEAFSCCSAESPTDISAAVDISSNSLLLLLLSLLFLVLALFAASGATDFREAAGVPSNLLLLLMLLLLMLFAGSGVMGGPSSFEL